MKTLLAVGFVTVVAVGSVVMPATAAGPMCPIGCGRQTKACVQSARVSVVACRAACRTTPPAAGGESCARGCLTTFHAAKGSCVPDQASCIALCSPPPPPSSCLNAFLDTCGQQLATGAESVVTQAKACVRGCGTAVTRAGCLQGCALAADAAAAQCRADFRACIGPCRPPTTTTTTTLPSPPCTTDAQCNDGNPCTADHCVNGVCEHACVCLDATGASTCCPGPAALCVHPTTTTTLPTPPCGAQPGTALCGGACPPGLTCAPATPLPTGAVPCACRTTECATAADCHGPLPQFCLPCGCAHWVCEAGQCVVAVCGPTAE